MNRRHAVNARAVALGAALTGALALGVAQAAPVDAAFSQDLPPGGSISTGSAVSPSDPLQLTVTAPQGGNVTIDEVGSPAQRPNGAAVASDAWVGPEFTLAAQEFQTLTVTMLADGAGFPAPPTFGANPQWRSKSEAMALCNSAEGAAAGFCVTTKAALAKFCWTGSSVGPTVCNMNFASNASEVKPQLLPDGNVQITFQLNVGASGGSLDVGYPSWSCGPNTRDDIIVNSPHFDHGTIGDLIAHGIYYSDGCSWASTVSGDVTIGKAAARQLHLRSTTIGRISGGPGWGPIELTRAAKSALRHVAHSIDVHVALKGHGPSKAQTWSYSETLHVKRR